MSGYKEAVGALIRNDVVHLGQLRPSMFLSKQITTRNSLLRGKLVGSDDSMHVDVAVKRFATTYYAQGRMLHAHVVGLGLRGFGKVALHELPSEFGLPSDH